MGSDMPVQQTASTTRRVLAWIIDYTIVMIPGCALVAVAVSVLVHGLPGHVGAVAAEFGWAQLIRLITHHGSGAGVLGTVASKEWLTFAAPLLGAVLAIPAIQFLYQVTLLRWRGRTIGKKCTGIRFGLARPGAPRLKGRRVFRRAFSTTFLETGLVSVALVLVIVGQYFAGMVLWAVAVVAFWANALVALGPRRRTVIDRLAGTVVVRPVVHAQVPAQAVEFAMKMSDMAQAAGQQGADLAVSLARSTPKAAIITGQIVSEAAQATGQVAREGVSAVITSAPVRQALNSRVGQRAQAWGAAGAGQARQAWKDHLEKRKPADPE